MTENNSHVHTVQHTQVLPARTIAQTTQKYNLYRHQPDKKKVEGINVHHHIKLLNIH